LKWTVDADAAGTRLDKFLASPDRLGSRAKAASALERGKVFLNEDEVSLANAATPLKSGDLVRVWMDRPGSSKARTSPREPGGLEILYEDDSLVVLNKPAGLLAVPLARRHEAPSVYHHLEEYLRPRGKRRPHVVHRIDRDTSGLVVFAKNAQAQERVKEQFRHREPDRIYLAVVYGHPEPRSGTWRDHLVWDDEALVQKETHPRDPRAKEAVSEYRVVEEFEATSLIEVRLHTGKRNQIRLQARLRGHTLVGEQRYVFGPSSLRPIEFPRQALHAWRLAFRHPEDGRSLRFEAPLPADMETLLGQLRRERRRAPSDPRE
jgi:23S rRNA pseudouridine1911/1915/1917 synthase